MIKLLRKSILDPGWLITKKKFQPEKYLEKRANFKDNLTFDEVSVQRRIDSVAEDWILFVPTSVTKEQVIGTIESYNLSESDGLGFVIHPVIFDNVKEQVFCFFTFFDIKTKKIYWRSEIVEDGSGYGYKQTYGYGLVSCTETYFDWVFKKAK